MELLFDIFNWKKKDERGKRLIWTLLFICNGNIWVSNWKKWNIEYALNLVNDLLGSIGQKINVIGHNNLLCFKGEKRRVWTFYKNS